MNTGLGFFASLDFSVVLEYGEPLRNGLLFTLWLTGAGFLLALPLGLGLALVRLLRIPVAAQLARGFVDVVRFTPILVQAVWIHFALPAISPFSLQPEQSALLALTLHVSTYVSEIFRSGITAIPKGQWEAGQVLGLRPVPLFWKVILPQVWPITLPPLANTLVATLKLTTILGILAINDLMKLANRINSATFRPVEIYTTAALIYLAIGLAITLGASALERHFAASRVGR